MLRNGVHDTASVSFFALTYEPFGEVVASQGFDRLTFASEVRDSTGLVYLGARYYDPELGRFYALDPLIGSPSAPQTLDRYVYCANSPLIHTDPTGKFWGMHILAGAVAGAIIGAVVTVASGGDLKQVAIAAASGAVGGAITACTFGLGSGTAMGTMVAVNSLKGAAAGATSNVVSSTLEGKAIDGKTLLRDTIVGGVTGGFGAKLKAPIENNIISKTTNEYLATKTYIVVKNAISNSAREIKDYKKAHLAVQYVTTQFGQLELKATSKGISLSLLGMYNVALSLPSGSSVRHMNAYRMN